MKYGSVCSGIEAATVAWHPLGWQPVFFSQFDPMHNYKNGPDFPSAVLAHHYPQVPNLGDMTKYKEWPDATINVLVGGTPCQSFSVAGLRAGLDDPRGNLMLTYCAIARKYRPDWVVWENVPGVLSSNEGRDFGSLLGLLSGRAVECPASGWQNCGVVPGIEGGYGLAWRVLDAQYFGVPQRRRRVFLVGCAGDWRGAAAVLLEPESMRGDSPPVRRSRKGIAGSAAPVVGGARSDGAAGTAEPIVVRTHNLHDDVKGDVWFTDTPGALQAIGSTPNQFDAVAFESRYARNGRGAPDDVVPPLKAQSGETGKGDAAPLVAFNWQSAGDVRISPQEEQAHSLARNQTQAVGIPEKQTVPFYDVSAACHTMMENYGEFTGDGNETRIVGEVAATLQANPSGPAGQDWQQHAAVAGGMTVRRLTPRECERLQGFEDDYTYIPLGAAHLEPFEDCIPVELDGVVTGYCKAPSDGPRYKALGNSMATPVMRWLGRRIEIVHAIRTSQPIPAAPKSQYAEAISMPPPSMFEPQKEFPAFCVDMQGGKGSARSTEEISPTLGADASNMHAVAIPILEPGKRTGVSTTDLRAGSGIGDDGDAMFTLQASAVHAVAVQPGRGPCAKRRVICTIHTAKGEEAIGENSCANPQPVCPREPGEGYEKCRTICQQSGHAELMALEAAREHGLMLSGAVAVVRGHHYACEPCAIALRDAGLSEITIQLSERL